MAISKFLQAELNRVIQKELVNTQFVDFGAILQSIKVVKTYTFPMGIMKGSFFSTGKPSSYSFISSYNGRKS